MHVSLVARWLRCWALLSPLALALACSSGGAKMMGSEGGEGGAGGAGGAGEAGSGGSSAGTGGSATAGTGGDSGSGGRGGTGAMPDAATASGPDADQPVVDSAVADSATTKPDVPVAGGPLALTSSVVAEGQVIATMYRCMHENVSPPLAWTPGPKGTQSYAMILRHATSLHWVLWDITADTLSLPMGVERAPMPAVPAGAKQVKPNLDGATWFGYTGPCPHSPTHYEYTIYALDVATLPGVTPQSASKQAETAVLAHKIAEATLSVTAAP